MNPKNHVRYEPGLRLRAKERRLGLVTVHVRYPDGREAEHQCEASPEECRFADWAGAIVSSPRLRALPDLERLVRENPPPQENQT